MKKPKSDYRRGFEAGLRECIEVIDMGPSSVNTVRLAMKMLLAASPRRSS